MDTWEPGPIRPYKVNRPKIVHVPSQTPDLSFPGSLPDPVPTPYITMPNEPAYTPLAVVTTEQFERLLAFLGLPEQAKRFFLAALDAPHDAGLFAVLADYLDDLDRTAEAERMRQRSGGLSEESQAG